MKKIEKLTKPLLLNLALLFSRKPESTGKLELSPNDKILLIRLNRIGDALVTTSFIEQLKEQTSCTIHVLADEKNYFVFSKVPSVSKTIIFRKGWQELRSLLKTLRAENYKVIVDLHDDVSTTVSMVILQLAVPFKFGLKKQNSKIFTATIPKPDASITHVVDRNLELLKLFGITPDRTKAGIKYYPAPSAITKAAEFIKNRFPEKKFTLGINISAGDNARFWGAAHYRELIKFLKQYDVNIIILSTTRDLVNAFRIYEDRSKIFYTPSFDEFAAIMSQLDMLFSPDTATIHLAAIYKIPVFGLYVKYQTNDIIWSPFGSDFSCVITEQPNLLDVTVEEVLEKFKPFLEKYLEN